MRGKWVIAVAALFGVSMAFMLAAGGGFELDAWIMGVLAGAALGSSQYLLLREDAKRRSQRCRSQG